MGNTKYTQAIKEQAAQLAREGLSNLEISEKLLVPEGTVKAWTIGHHVRGRGGSRPKPAPLPVKRVHRISAGGHVWQTLAGWAAR